jgi:hypothetical protein
MTDQELDVFMKRVLLDAIKRDCEKETDEVPAFVPTQKHQRQMAAMLAAPDEWAHKRAQPVWKKVLQKVAVILLVVSLSFGGVMVASPTARAAVVRWVTEWYETHITYRYSGEQISEQMPQYEITELPEGYVEVESERIEWPSLVRIVYRNENADNDIYLSYIYMQQGSASDYVLEDAEIIPVSVNGMDGQLFLEHDWEHKRSTVTWIDPEKNLQFNVDATLNKDDILRMAESVSLVEAGK